jgi:hypothetical protein
MDDISIVSKPGVCGTFKDYLNAVMTPAGAVGSTALFEYGALSLAKISD